ncbi:MAG: hypothetical protein KJ044_03220, partial [Planctomycetes bacterium]|nr:hypothetical protein [Planctomycetota bacterium]
TPPARPLLDPARLAGLAPLAIEARDLRSTRRLMNRAKFRLRDLMRAAGESEGEPEGSPEQHFVDLREAVRLFGAKWDDNQGTHADKAAWDRYMRDLGAALDGLRDAKTGPDARARFAAVGKVCDDCHNAGDWAEPFEWQFSDLKR